MKSTFTSLFDARLFLQVMACVVLTLSVTAGFAQNALTAPAELSATGDLVRSGWMQQDEYSKVLDQERSQATQQIAITDQGTSAHDLYVGYDRLLAYMQADLGAGLPIENIADSNYKKVVQESASDPALQNMQVTEFNTLYDVLVKKLQQ